VTFRSAVPVPRKTYVTPPPKTVRNKNS
jgi:hypothetical protein